MLRTDLNGKMMINLSSALMKIWLGTLLSLKQSSMLERSSWASSIALSEGITSSSINSGNGLAGAFGALAGGFGFVGASFSTGFASFVSAATNHRWKTRYKLLFLSKCWTLEESELSPKQHAMWWKHSSIANKQQQQLTCRSRCLLHSRARYTSTQSCWCTSHLLQKNHISFLRRKKPSGDKIYLNSATDLIFN